MSRSWQHAYNSKVLPELRCHPFRFWQSMSWKGMRLAVQPADHHGQIFHHASRPPPQQQPQHTIYFERLLQYINIVCALLLPLRLRSLEHPAFRKWLSFWLGTVSDFLIHYYATSSASVPAYFIMLRRRGGWLKDCVDRKMLSHHRRHLRCSPGHVLPASYLRVRLKTSSVEFLFIIWPLRVSFADLSTTPWHVSASLRRWALQNAWFESSKLEID